MNFKEKVILTDKSKFCMKSYIEEKLNNFDRSSIPPD